MLTRLQKSMKDKDKGFTLIELLVVIVIIGIWPRSPFHCSSTSARKAWTRASKSDLKSAATILETKTTDGAWTTESAVPVTTLAPDFKATTGNTVTVKAGSSSTAGYCITATNTGATGPAYYNSQTGGLTTTAADPRLHIMKSAPLDAHRARSTFAVDTHT
jgi:prepilin-type N-terminal cleavage/methylation domain-containing protein